MTLIELLIVIVCLAIAAVLVVPEIGAANALSLPKAAELVSADLQFAQLQAMQSAVNPVVVVFKVSGNSYQIARASDPATPITNPADGQPYVVTFGQGRAAPLAGVTIQSLALGSGGNTLTYAAYGSLAGGADAQITLAAHDHTLTLTVNASTGAVTIGQIQ